MIADRNPLQWLNETVRVTRDAVFFGEDQVPGCIAQNGITLKPGGGQDINKLTIEFLVGEVITEDPTKDVN